MGVKVSSASSRQDDTVITNATETLQRMASNQNIITTLRKEIAEKQQQLDVVLKEQHELVFNLVSSTAEYFPSLSGVREQNKLKSGIQVLFVDAGTDHHPSSFVVSKLLRETEGQPKPLRAIGGKILTIASFQLQRFPEPPDFLILFYPASSTRAPEGGAVDEILQCLPALHPSKVAVFFRVTTQHNSVYELKVEGRQPQRASLLLHATFDTSGDMRSTFHNSSVLSTLVAWIYKPRTSSTATATATATDDSKQISPRKHNRSKSDRSPHRRPDSTSTDPAHDPS